MIRKFCVVLMLAGFLVGCSIGEVSENPPLGMQYLELSGDCEGTDIHLPLVVSAGSVPDDSRAGALSAVEITDFERVGANRGTVADSSEQPIFSEAADCRVEVKSVNTSTQPPAQLNKEQFCLAVWDLELEETRFIIWWYDQITYAGNAYSAMAFREQMPEVGVIQLSLHPPGTGTEPVHLYNHLLNHELSHFKEYGNEVHGSGFREALGTLSAGGGRYKYQMFDAMEKEKSDDV